MTDSIDVGKAITHLFDDKDWISKSIIGGILALAPIIGFVIAGYEVRLARNVSRGEAQPMPAWDDFGQMFIDGLWLGLSRIILGFPAFLLFFVPFIGFYALIFAGAFLEDSSNARNVEQALSVMIPGGLLASAMCCGAGILYSLSLGFVSPAVTANYARHGTFASCFNFSQIFRLIRRNPSNYLMVWATGFLAGLIYIGAVSVVNFIPCLNLLLIWPVSAFASFWLYMALGHAVGQLLALDAANPAADNPLLTPVIS